MITNIEIHGPATFANPVRLTTAKKVNLIYGLNGTGKSTICRFLKAPTLPDFKHCSILPQHPPALYVYNQEFIHENFYESDTQKGIFSLSKENKDAELRIGAARTKRAAHLDRKQQLENAQNEKESGLQRAKQIAEDKVWEIKTSHTGGDRVLEYCLDGLKAKKENLLNHLVLIQRPTSHPGITTQQLKSEALALTGDNAQLIARIPFSPINTAEIETDPLFETPIVGSKNSAVSALIQRLGNSDWVQEGLAFTEGAGPDATPCPFCQASTVTEKLLNELHAFFDESYKTSVELVRSGRTRYLTLIDRTPRPGDLKPHPFSTDKLLLLAEQLHSLMQANLRRIEEKLQNPSSTVVLADLSAQISELSVEIDQINGRIDAHNERLRDKAKAQAEIKTRFWNLMRWDYDQAIARYTDDRCEAEAAHRDILQELESVDQLLKATDQEISEAQRATVNVDEAMTNINNALADLGIDDFQIERHDEVLYRLKRKSSRGSNKFTTLSEGEKMIITLLYFCELCKGRRSATDTNDDKVVVFDDPISSLSHLYVFNVGQLIRSIFFQSNVAKQVFVFTHSLYFFYELADTNHQRREQNQALFRLTKGGGQSQIHSMSYDEIQNDYQAYWQVVNDPTQHPALIANCMRNIVDHFFAFVEKLDFTNVFQKPALRANKFTAFSRFMNRESHSFGQNLYDLKEFDYQIFKEGLRLIFEESGYKEHYAKMSRI